MNIYETSFTMQREGLNALALIRAVVRDDRFLPVSPDFRALEPMGHLTNEDSPFIYFLHTKSWPPGSGDSSLSKTRTGGGKRLPSSGSEFSEGLQNRKNDALPLRKECTAWTSGRVAQPV